VVAANLDPPTLLSLGITERPQAMPDQYKVSDDPVLAYRQYYLGEKSQLLAYTERGLPAWVSQK